MVCTLLNKRDLPCIQGSEKMKQILLENEYGLLPDVPYTMSVSDPICIENRYCAGKVTHSVLNFTISTEFGTHTIPVQRILHCDGTQRPFFIFLNFRPDVPDMYYPTEEIGDRGFDVLTVCYKDITSDNGDFSNGLAGVLLPNGQQDEKTCGKIILWAWFAMRMMDYALTLPCLDSKNASVVGHSRLGKTALVTAMLDERIRYAFSSCSGCSGAALSKLKQGERISDITKVFPYWFCKKYAKYSKDDYAKEFDQHFLISSIAPRYVYVSSGVEDLWADPESEFLSCVASNPAFEALGVKGFVHNDNMPLCDEIFHKGRIGYHMHSGKHFLARCDWNNYMDFIKLHMKECK